MEGTTSCTLKTFTAALHLLRIENPSFQSLKSKRKFRPRTGHEDPEGEYNHSSTLSSTSVLDKGECLTPRLGRFTPGKETRYWKLGGRQRRCGRVRKISPPQEFDLRTVQPLASRYTCYAISALFDSVASNLFSEL